MVRNATSLTSNGLRDWLIQRVSSIILAAYVLCLVGFFITHPNLQFEQWQAFNAQTSMRIFTVLALLSLLLHSWVGVWTVTTDYLKCAYVRVTVQVFVILMLVVCFVWGVGILWGNI